MNLILIGPQGSGKGTQAEKLVVELGLTHIEMGALIRERAEKHDRKAEIIDHLVNKKGQLLPDGIVLDMIDDELDERPTDKGYLFDGFPRTVAQYQALKEMLKQRDLTLSVGLYLAISHEESVKRLKNRGRVDDTPEAIGCRLDLFQQNTQPILKIMKAEGILVEINGEQAPEAIFKEVKEKLANAQGPEVRTK